MPFDTFVQTAVTSTGGLGGGSGLTLTVINGQSIPTFEDSTRGDKILSISEQPIMFSEKSLTDLAWIDIGDAIDADSGYIADLDGTVVFATGHCEDTSASSKEIHLFINGVDNGSLGTLSGGANATFVNTTLDLDFSQGDRLRLQAQNGVDGKIEDTVIKVSFRWRG